MKKKLNGQFFFLVGPDFSSSEESSTVKYSECALIEEYHNAFEESMAKPHSKSTQIHSKALSCRNMIICQLFIQSEPKSLHNFQVWYL